MKPFTSVRGRVLPLLRDNVDTDVIIRIECVSLPREALGPHAFASLRGQPGSPLDDPGFAGAPILVAGDNFGCGSSREMAVWALMAMGLRCVIAPRFGEIFYSNCFQNGLLPVRLAPRAAAEIGRAAAGGALELEVDLAAQQIRGMPAGEISFDLEPLRKRLLLEGMDEIDLAARHLCDVDAWQARDRAARPWIYAAAR